MRRGLLRGYNQPVDLFCFKSAHFNNAPRRQLLTYRRSLASSPLHSAQQQNGFWAVLSDRGLTHITLRLQVVRAVPCDMLPYQAVAMDYAVSSSFQRQPPIGLGVNINPAFTHSWFVPADLCVPYKQAPLLEPGHVKLIFSAEALHRG